MRRIFAVAIAVFPVAAAAQSADSVLERAVTTYSRLNSIRAEFRQTLTNPLTGSSATTTGVILRRKPNLLNISFDNGDRIVADGTSLWLYLPSSVPGQVIRSPSRAVASSAFDPAGEVLVSPRTRYSVTGTASATIGGRPSHVLSLTPKSESVPFSKVKLWVDDADASVRQFEVTDANGLTRLIVITRLASNPSLPRRAFRFTPPKGVRVIDQPLVQPD